MRTRSASPTGREFREVLGLVRSRVEEMAEKQDDEAGNPG
jgi:hypothetical protein